MFKTLLDLENEDNSGFQNPIKTASEISITDNLNKIKREYELINTPLDDGTDGDENDTDCTEE